MDGELLMGFSEWVMNNSGCYADRVLGEFNELSNGRTSLEDVDSALTDAGYKRGNSIQFDQVCTGDHSVPHRFAQKSHFDFDYFFGQERYF